MSERQIEEIGARYSILLSYSEDDPLCQYVYKNFGLAKSCRYTFFGDKVIPTQYL